MEIYIFCILFILLSAIIESIDKHMGKILFSISILLLFCVSAMRGMSVGVDTKNYWYQYNGLNINNLRSDLEIGWYFLMWICKNIFNSYRLLLIIVSILTIFFVKKSICNFSTNWNLSLYYFVTFYFYFQSFNIMRQILAASIILYAFTLIKQKKLFHYVFFVVIAASFHTSALIALPMYYISRIKLSFFTTSILIVLSFIISSVIAPYILEYIEGIELYQMYVYEDLKEDSYFSKNLLLHSCIAGLLFFDKNNRGYMLTICLMGILIANSLSLFSAVARIAIYMKMAIILVMPNLYIQISKIKLTLTVQICIAILMFISCLVMLKSNTEGVYPYVIL